MNYKELKKEHCEKCRNEIGITPCCKGNCVEVGLLEKGYQEATDRARNFLGDLMLWANLSEDDMNKMNDAFNRYMLC